MVIPLFSLPGPQRQGPAIDPEGPAVRL